MYPQSMENKKYRRFNEIFSPLKDDLFERCIRKFELKNYDVKKFVLFRNNGMSIGQQPHTDFPRAHDRSIGL